MDLKSKTLDELVVLTKELLGEGVDPRSETMLSIVREVRERGDEVAFVHAYLDRYDERQAPPQA